MWFIIMLIIIVVFVVASVKDSTPQTKSSPAPSATPVIHADAITLTNIMIKYAKSKFDYGSFTAKRDGFFYMMMDGLMESNLTDSGLKYTFGFTATEISFIRRCGNIYDETLAISFRCGYSNETFDQVCNLLRENENIFSEIQWKNDSVTAIIRG